MINHNKIDTIIHVIRKNNMSFYSLPKDVLHMWVRDYVRPLDYHRLLRVCKLFHVLNTEERIKKEYKRRLDQKAASATKRNCHKLCLLCERPVSKRRKHRHEISICFMNMNQTKNYDLQKFISHVYSMRVICPCDNEISPFYFLKMFNHKKSCSGKISYEELYTSPYPNAKERWLKRLEAREINIRNKEQEKYEMRRAAMRDLFFM